MKKRSDPVVDHLDELRKRLLFTLGWLFLWWLALFSLFSHLVPFLIWPYQRAFPGQPLSLVFTSLPEALIAALKTTFFLALSATLPLVLWQAWRFIAPSLYKSEKRFLRKLLFLVFFFSFIGVGVAYFLVLPHLLRFFLGLGYGRFEPYLRIQSYLNFLGKGIFIAGLVAQIPGITALLVKGGILSPSLLKRCHLYVLGASFLMGLFLAPTDLLSQIILASIFFLLFEAGFLLAKIL